MVVTITLSIIVGFVVGVLSGLLGVGGGTILVPVFSVFFGLAPVAATGTSLFTIIFTSLSGAIARVRGKTCVVKVAIALGIGGAVTSPLGVYAATISPDLAVVLAVSAVILYSIINTLRKALKTDPVQEAIQSSDREERKKSLPLKDDRSDLDTFTLALGVRSLFIGLITGFLSGYVGLGGGFLMIPLMRSLLDYSMKQASGTSLLAILFIALSGSIAQIYFGNVDFLIGIPVIIGSIPGAIVGGMLVSRFKDRTLSFLFVGFLFIATILFIVKQFGLLG